MTLENLKKPEYLFEISWEVCNMVGGIYTVISSKAKQQKEAFGDNYITIGPDVWKETHKNPYFIEDLTLFSQWKQQAAVAGLKFKVGRWAIKGRPIAILVDFTPLFPEKDNIFAHLWETYQLDSIHGPWDYVEPAMFGYAAGKVIESFYRYFLTGYDRVVAHFHEWMTGSGVLYLKEYTPQIATVFTTHATYLGRSIAGNGLPLYKDLPTYNPTVMANRLNITAQHSLESLAAKEADAFTTVSNITANECRQFLGRNPDAITINGFDPKIVGDVEQLPAKRGAARKKILKVASILAGSPIADDAVLIISSGRYEYKNKGIDRFIEALGVLNKNADLKKDVVAVIAVPANSAGPVKALADCLADPQCEALTAPGFTTHFLHDAVSDAVLSGIQKAGLTNEAGSRVKIMFIPVYLKGEDGIFDLKYYDFLTAFDLSVFPSYYEPWGYTPLESIAFGIPTITTSLAGFGIWVREMGMTGKSVIVIDRKEDNNEAVVEQIQQNMLNFAGFNPDEREAIGKEAHEIAAKAWWSELLGFYYTAWDVALSKLNKRDEVFEMKRYTETLRPLILAKQDQPTWKKILFQPVYTKELQKLHELAQNLWWSWNDDAIALFEGLDPEAWLAVEHNPVHLMEGLSSKQMEAIEQDTDYVARINKVYHRFKTYLEGASTNENRIAYFSMEYGLHKSLKIYSGGLGILAGDYLKEASDSAVNLVGLGLLYRYGYFQQDISLFGDQVAQYIPQKFTHLPLEPVRDASGNWITVSVALPGRTVIAKAWKVPVGRIPLYLLDTDIEENQPNDRNITHQLYGGDSEMRFKQEMILGIGGIRLIEKLKLCPTIYHSNEGHSAFTGLERLRILIQDYQLSFDVAKEIVRGSNLFTTHTPVPAGHDSFEENLLRTYMPHYAERLNISWDDFVNLGRFKANDVNEKFSMSVLATNLSQQVNGVSKIHGRVSREMFQPLYPGYFANELHIGYVTNGVHYPTWTDSAVKELYAHYLTEGFEQDQSNAEKWKAIQQAPDEKVWQLRLQLKEELITYLKYRIKNDLTKRQESPKLIFKTIESLNSKALIIGFARRFATYKRAYLLFSNLERLGKIVNNPDKPVLFVFAGKAHPNDKAGQDLIKKIIDISKMPVFIGKVIFVENYDMDLGKKLTSSCDIWLNTPTRPLEASGTSGEKAVMNGVLNFSVLDGWWAEGYKPNAGWAIEEQRTYANQQFQDEMDAETIYNLLETEIVPNYFDRNTQGVPEKWVKYIKNNISGIAPHFTMKRMIDDYFDRFYNKLIVSSNKNAAHHYEAATQMAAWKQKVKNAWDAIHIQSIKVPDPTVRPLDFGENFVAEITLLTPGLESGEIAIELLFGRKLHDKIDEIVFVESMNIIGSGDGWVQYHINVPVYRAGVYDYTFRIYPIHPDLPHRQDFPLVKWL